MVSVNFTDTTDQIRVSWMQKWSDIYEFIDTVTISTKLPPRVIRDSDERKTDNEIYNDELLRLQRSGLHKIASRPVVLQITNVLQWIATHVDFRRMPIVSDEGKVLGLLMANNFHNIYHLKPAEVKCNKEYLDNFYVTHPKPHEVMKLWYKEEDDFKYQARITKYNPCPFISLVQYLTEMLSRLHGEADCTNFKSEWLPLSHGVMSTGTIFNWASIMSSNLLQALEKAILKQDPKGTPFYFAGYMLDALSTSNPFPGLNWSWTLRSPPIHLYCKELWRENNYKEMYTICDQFIAPAYRFFLGLKCPEFLR